MLIHVFHKMSELYFYIITMLWSDRANGPEPAGLKYEVVLRAGPGHTLCGPGPGLIIQFAGQARAGTPPLLRARAPISGLCRALD